MTKMQPVICFKQCSSSFMMQEQPPIPQTYICTGSFNSYSYIRLPLNNLKLNSSSGRYKEMSLSFYKTTAFPCIASIISWQNSLASPKFYCLTTIKGQHLFTMSKKQRSAFDGAFTSQNPLTLGQIKIESMRKVSLDILFPGFFGNFDHLSCLNLTLIGLRSFYLTIERVFVCLFQLQSIEDLSSMVPL